jgi:ribosome-binding factor A
MSHRLEKINELIRIELGKILLEEEEFGSGVLVTLLQVKTSADLRDASVILSVFPTEKEAWVIKKLESHIFGLQQLLNKKIQTRTVPKIRFILNSDEAESQKIETLIKKIDK